MKPDHDIAERAQDDQDLALGQQLCFAAYSVNHAFNRTYKPLLDEIGLTYPQYLVMLALWQTDGMTVKALGNALGLDSGTLSPLLQRLESGEFVRRRRGAQDERQVIITLTEKSSALKVKAFDVLKRIGTATGCSPQESEQMRVALHALGSRLRQSAGH